MRMACENLDLKHWELFGLNRNPFPVAPDVENFFISKAIDRLVTEIVHGILTRKGFLVLTGEVGLGKTTIGRKILMVLEEKGIESSLVFQTSYGEADLLRAINRDFGLLSGGCELSDQMEALNRFLVDQNREGRNCAIIVDDAQNLSMKCLELLRMISNLEADGEKLVQILLIGQPELLDRMDSRELRQLKSRIVIQRQVSPLSREELGHYIQFKLNSAGSQGTTTVSGRAVKKVHRLTRGNLRRVNVLMDRAMYAAYLGDTREITEGVVKEAWKDLDEKRRPVPLKRFALAASIALILVGAFSVGIARMDPQKRPGDLRAGEAARSPLGTPSHARVSTPGPSAPGAARPDAAVSEAVDRFLDGYGLGRFREDFLQAVRLGQWEWIREAIYGTSGHLLVSLPEGYERLRSRYGVLTISSEEGRESRRLVLWRPPFRVEKFYMGFRGPEIVKLQERLSRAGHYCGALDGIVGPRLMAAVVQYQEEHHIRVNGYPDEQTLFVLHQEEG